MSAVLKFLKGEPALIYLAVAVSAACGFLHLAHATTVQSGAVMAAVAAAGSLATAVLAKPISVSLLTGAVTTFLTAVSPFWLHLPTGQVQLLAAGVISGLSLVLRQHVTPAVNAAAAAS